MENKICLQCGKEFTPVSSRQKFCSLRCTGLFCAAHRKNRRCLTCGKEYKPTANHQRFCSRHCRDQFGRSPNEPLPRGRVKGYRKKTDISYCMICGREFVPSYQGQKYCSDECRNDPLAHRMRVFFTGLINKLECKRNDS